MDEHGPNPERACSNNHDVCFLHQNTAGASLAANNLQNVTVYLDKRSGQIPATARAHSRHV